MINQKSGGQQIVDKLLHDSNILQTDDLESFQLLFNEFPNWKENYQLVDLIYRSVFNSSTKITQYLESMDINFSEAFSNGVSMADFYMNSFLDNNYEPLMDSDVSEELFRYYLKYLNTVIYFRQKGAPSDPKLIEKLKQTGAHKKLMKIKYIQEFLK